MANDENRSGAQDRQAGGGRHLRDRSRRAASQRDRHDVAGNPRLERPGDYRVDFRRRALECDRRFHRTNWFEHTIADFGQSQGNVATGFVLADMVDPQRLTSTANDYGYKQLAYEPILGGGLITALSVPMITEFGLPAFTVASFALLIVVGLWGIRRRAPR